MNKLHLEVLRENIKKVNLSAEIAKFFRDIVKFAPLVLDIIKKVNEYCAKYLIEEPAP